MAVEEQTSGSFIVRFAGGVNWDRIGQRLIISNRTVSKLAFKTKRVGSLSSTITFTIRKVSNDSIIVSKVYGSASSVPTSAGFIEVTFDTPVLINEQVRILMEWSGTLGDVNNYLEFWATTSSVKPSENVSRYNVSYTDTAVWDATYRYTYTVEVAPTVTTQAASNIGETTATANGNITDLGSPNPTAHGFAYSPTDTTPDIETDSVTDEGAASSTGAFTSDLTGLTPGLLYYMRAYATNTAGTSYGSVVTVRGIRAVGAGYVWQDGPFVHFGGEDGNEVIYNPPLTVSGSEDPGYLWTEGTELNVVDSAGDERSEEGTATGDTGPEGTAFIEGSELHYLDETAGAERTH